jgi:hypothetical protein
MDIIQRPVFYLEQNVSETGFYLHLQVEPTQVGSTDREIYCVRTPATTPTGSFVYGLCCIGFINPIDLVSGV